jgi:Flp pilus assembly protein TadB
MNHHRPINPFTALWALSHHFLFMVVAGIIFPPLGIAYLVIAIVYCIRRVRGVRRYRRERLAQMLTLQEQINQSPRVLALQMALANQDGNHRQLMTELRRMRTYA